MSKTIVARHKVKDINIWLKGHEERMQIFAPAISGFKTFQDQDDPNSVMLVIKVTDMEKFGAIMYDPKTQDAKERHTVLEPITMSMQVDL